MLIGLVISVALISSIPMYTQAVLQRSLIRDMENYQKKNNTYTGAYLISINMDSSSIYQKLNELEEKGENPLENSEIVDFYKNLFSTFTRQEQYIKDNVEKKIGLPVLAKVYRYSSDKKRIQKSAEDEGGSDSLYANLQSLTDMENHIRLLDGRMPSKVPVDGVYETLVPEGALRKLDMMLDREYVLQDAKKKWGIEPIRVRPVGVFTVKDKADPYWTFFNPDQFNESFLLDENLLRKDFIDKYPNFIYYAQWYYAFDYHALSVGSLGGSLAGHESILKNLSDLCYKNNNVSINAPSMKEVLWAYAEKSRQLVHMLWALNVPIIIMLWLYLFMISKLIISREGNEIALLSSRGATRLQIVLGYLLEGVILGGIAMVLGPILGLQLTGLLGASDGFLEFAGRKALEVRLEGDAYTYAALTVCLSIATILIPAFAASRTGIVEHKRKTSRYSGLTFWEKAFVDVILLGISGYGIYTFMKGQYLLKASGISAGQVQADPLLFLVPTLFILGSGLLVIRFYPLLVKLIYTLGKRHWTPPVYATLIQVGRSLKSYHFLMIFLIMTISVGTFSAVAARTINLNSREKIFYGVGSTMSLVPLWQSEKAGSYSFAGGSGASDESASNRVQYYEPSFLPYTKLEGVEQTAKVFRKEQVFAQSSGKNAENVNLMGIEPYEFGKTAWFRNGLLRGHINQYLNLLASEPSSCLISTSLSRELGVKEGDYIQVSWPGTAQASFTVYGIVDYWPSWNPNINPLKEKKEEPRLFVGNLQYIQDHLSLEPYEVWLKLKPDATSRQVYEDIADKRLSITSITDANQEMVELKNDPFQLAINGAVTLGFIICSLICFCGFLLYWILSISSRTLQFGIFRAMGLSARQLLSMMFIEQVLTSGAGIVAGAFIGLVTGRLFVPFFQSAFDAYSQVPPFKVISYAGDRFKVYVMMGITVMAGLAVLGWLLSRININQAIKLGED